MLLLMTNNIVTSIESLPVEVLHRIFDNLDVKTIIFSIRPLSRLFRSITNTYNRYILDFQLISKLNFNVLCRLINPENVISLILSDDDRTSNQIDLFISLVCIKQFTRLHSLTLLYINESQLNFILKRINLNFLTSFSFDMRKYNNRRIKTTTNLLSSIISKTTLRKVELHIKPNRMSEISWPINCSIHYLILNDGININNLIIILQSSPYLYKLIIKRNFDNFTNDTISTFSSLKPFRQLKFLSIELPNIYINQIEPFLLLTPSLIYLKLSGFNHNLDGKRWENFIQTNLSQLDKFEFFFSTWETVKYTPTDLKLIISSFQTPFWIEYKKWFVTCEYNVYNPRTINFYPLPRYRSHLDYIPNSQKTSLSTNSIRLNNDSIIIENINSFELTLLEDMIDDIKEKETMINYPMFPKVTEIEINLMEKCTLILFQSLSIFFNISQIVQMTLSSDYFDNYNQNTIINIKNFIEQAHNLYSLSIHNYMNKYYTDKMIENIYSFIPSNIKHLHIPIKNINKIIFIFQRCKYLSTIQLDFEHENISEEIMKWFDDNTIYSTCYKKSRTFSVWIGKMKIQSNDNIIDYKRFKTR